MSDDRALLSWIRTLEEEGLLLIDGVPTERGQLYHLSTRVAYMRTTGFGYASSASSNLMKSWPTCYVAGAVNILHWLYL